MYVYHEFLYLILTRQVEGKGVGAGPKKTTAKNAWASSYIFSLRGGVWRTLTKLKIFYCERVMNCFIKRSRCIIYT
jgi:hypothetical protein